MKKITYYALFFVVSTGFSACDDSTAPSDNAKPKRDTVIVIQKCDCPNFDSLFAELKKSEKSDKEQDEEQSAPEPKKKTKAPCGCPDNL